jgi:hypothetical protein
MNKFKIVGILLVFLVLTSPVLLLFIPSWTTKVSPALNLVSTLMGPGAEDNLALGDFTFVGADNETLLIQLDLNINNTGGDMLFPAVNLSLSYGSHHLGNGWVNPEVLIPGGTVGTVPVYARMLMGDAFNMFLLSMIGGGLSLDVSSGEAYLFLNTFGDTQAGVISIPLPSIPLPALDMGGESVWPPTIHQLTRGAIAADTAVSVTVNVTDKGGGVRAAILSWTNGTQWENTTMTGLPMKPLMGGPGTLLGGLIQSSFPSYPASPIPTTYSFGLATGTIPGHPADSNISYRVYLIDDFDYVTLVPSTAPSYTVGTADSMDLANQTYSYTVVAAPISTFTSVWTYGGGDGGDGGAADLLASLEASGIDILGAVMEGSSLLSMMSGNFSPEAFIAALTGMVEYLEVRGVDPFEVVDQLLGLSGGIPDVDTGIVCRDNSNMSIAMDLLAEGQISLLELITLLDVNMTLVVNSLARSVRPPLATDLFTLLNTTRTTPAENASFYTFLDTHDLYYQDYAFSWVYKHDATSGNWTDLTDQAFALAGDANTTYYFGAPKLSGLLGDTPIANFTMVDFDITPAALTNNGSRYSWEYYTSGAWASLPIAEDETANLTTSGRIFFAPAGLMGSTKPFTAAESLCWIRLSIEDTLNETVPVAAVSASVEYIPFYYQYLAKDMFGRTTETMIVGETDSFTNLLTAMNATNGYAGKIAGMITGQGVEFDTLLAELEGGYITIQGPVTESEIVTTVAPMLGLVVYGILLLGLLAAVRGRGGSYSVKPGKVKQWYEEMTAPEKPGELKRPK